MRTRLTATLMVSLALAACGGGGDGAPADARFDAARAWANVLAADIGFTLSGVGSDGRAYTLAVALAPAGFGAYPLTGQVGARGLQISTLARNGVSLGTTTTTQFYDATAALLIGATSDDGSCATVIGHGLLPTAAAVGSAGVLYNATSFDRCDASARPIGSVAASWSIEAEAGIALFCINSEQLDALGNVEASEADCIQLIDSLGSLGPLARTTVVIPGTFSLVARNY